MLKDIVMKSLVQKVPKGWMTTIEWAKQEGLGEGSVGLYLRKGVAMGVIEKKFFMVNRSGVIRPVPHYRVKS